MAYFPFLNVEVMGFLATYHVKTNIEGEGAEKLASISTIMNRIEGGWAMSQSKQSWQKQGHIKASLKSPTYCSCR